LASKKAEIASEPLDAPAIDGALTKVELVRPPETESSTVVLGEGPGAAAAVVDVLDELGVLS
jgi:electron transfer flavoprotein beta subunit